MTDKVSLKTRIAQWIADHLPQEIVYFCGLRLMAYMSVIIGDDPSNASMGDVLASWRQLYK